MTKINSQSINAVITPKINLSGAANVPEWLQGPKGDTGRQGAPGNDGYTPVKGLDYWTNEEIAAIEAEIAEGVTQGAKGDDGASAYEVAVAAGFVGSETEWLSSLKGETGAQGQRGEKGEVGPTGLTGSQGERGERGAAFTYSDFTQEQLEQLTGPTGDIGPIGPKGDTGAAFKYSDFTQEQLAALTGPKGEKGETGLTGAKGDTGAAGKDGEQGPKGDAGERGAAGERGPKGDAGAKGADGYTPVKGTDYFTSAELAQIAADAAAAVDLSNYYNKTEINSMIGDIEALLAAI